MFAKFHFGRSYFSIFRLGVLVHFLRLAGLVGEYALTRLFGGFLGDAWCLYAHISAYVAQLPTTVCSSLALYTAHAPYTHAAVLGQLKCAATS